MYVERPKEAFREAARGDDAYVRFDDLAHWAVISVVCVVISRSLRSNQP